MKGSGKKRGTEEQIYKSIREFKKKFFPKSFGEQSTEALADPRDPRINLARESLDMVRRRLVKQ